MKRYVSLPLMFIIATWVVAPGWAQAGSGFYLSGDLGLNIASGINTTGFSNDRASVCDEDMNPLYDRVEPFWQDQNVDLKYIPNCTGPNRGSTGNWGNEFDGATGILAGAAVGYSFAGQNPNGPLGGLRVELEYFYRQSNYDQTSAVSGYQECGGPNESTNKLCQEIYKATDRIGSMSSRNLFANLYYDFANTSRFTPYIGVGGGFGDTNMEYGSVWARKVDASQITTGGDPDGRDGPGTALPNAGMIQQNLAGTVSAAQASLSDTLYGLQILFGVDYAMTEAMSLGLKGRWVRFSSFQSGNDVVWDPLRSNPPYLRKEGAADREHVSGGIRTNNIEFFGISVNMKYHF